MPTIKVGLIGCGKQAGKHIAGLLNIPRVELVLSDIRSDLAEELALKNGVQWTDHPDSILSDSTIQAVVICTPTQSHISLIKAALNGDKDVFCEKPLCDSIKEAYDLKEYSKHYEQVVMIGYVYRFVPIFGEGYKLLCEHKINGESLVLGRILSAFFRLGGRGGHQAWKHKKASGGGAINEMLVHMIDLANWYFGPLKNVEVISCDLRYPQRIINGEKVEADAEDFILFRCLGTDGSEILCQGDLITPAFSQYVEIQGENGTFMGSIQSDMPSYIFLKESRGGYSVGKTMLQFGRRNVLDIQMMAFIQSVLRRQFHDRNSIDDSLALMHILEEIRGQVKR
jgi:predicted dehydrogenase